MTASVALAAGDGQVERVVGRGRLATVIDHRHDPRAGRHRDPSEESFVGPALVFSEGEAWQYRSSIGTAAIDPHGVLLVEAGTFYQARHDRSWPEDRSTTIRFDARAVAALGRCASAPGSSAPEPGESGAPARFFAAWWLPRKPALEAARLALTAAASRADGEAIDGAAITLLGLVGSAELVGGDTAATDVREGRDRVADGAAWLRANLGEEIRLVDLALATHTSPFHLSRLFRRHLGLPPGAYLRRVRLERAAEILRDGELPVTEVCFAVGFGNLSHFVTTFRTTYGVSPGDYRRGRRAARSPGTPTSGRT